MTLFELIRSEGYDPVVGEPGKVPDALGDPPDPTSAAVMTPRGLVVLEDSWDHAYAASHEIAEERYGFRGHTVAMLEHQAWLLARWLRKK